MDNLLFHFLNLGKLSIKNFNYNVFLFIIIIILCFLTKFIFLLKLGIIHPTLQDPSTIISMYFLNFTTYLSYILLNDIIFVHRILA